MSALMRTNGLQRALVQRSIIVFLRLHGTLGPDNHAGSWGRSESSECYGVET